MKWIGKHPVFSDLLIGGVLLTPPDNQYSYELTLPNDDGTAGQVLTTDGNGVLTWVTNSAGGTGVSMTNGVDNRIMTATGAQAITGEADLTYDSSILTLSSTSAANLPAILLMNNHAGADGATLSFQKIQDGSDNDEVGVITWQSDDDTGGAFNVGHITGWVADASNNDEAGKIELKVMTDGTGVQVLTTDGNGVLTWVTNSAGGTGVSMTNGVDNRIMTATGAQAITGEADLTYDSSILTLSSTSAANLPAILLMNNHAGADGATLSFQKIQDGSDNDEVGVITWQSDDDTGGAFNVGHITGWVADASNNDEAGKIELKVMTDGTGVQQGLTATGSGTSEQVDVSIAHGTASTTTIAGTLTMGSTAAMTNAGLLSVANQSNITGLGTISSGTWEATDIGVAHGGTGLSTVGTNYLLTGNGTSALSAESGLLYDASNQRLEISGTNDIEIESKLTTGNDLINLAYGRISFDQFNVFGTGLSGLIEIKDGSGTMFGANMTIKAGGASGGDKDGGDIILLGGRGTGSQGGGKILFYTSVGGVGSASNTDYNTSQLKLTVGTDGSIDTEGDVTVGGGDIILEGTGRIQGIDTITDSTDAASKGYVDGLIPTVPDEVVSTGTHIHKQTKTTLDAAQCNLLFAGPRTLVSGQGANTIIVPVSVTVLVDNDTGTADSSGADLIVGYNSTTNYQLALRYMRRFMLGITTDMQFNMAPFFAGHGATSLTGGTNVPLTIATSAAITAGSLTSMTIYTSYYVIDNS